MNPRILLLLFFCLITTGREKLNADDYTFFVRQVQMPWQLQWDVAVQKQGSQQSPLAVNPNGARFELWAVKATPLTSYQVDTTYVNSYIPVATVKISSDDPYQVIPRTRADKPFTVTIVTNGLTSNPTAPAAAQQVKILRHNQSYPEGSDGSNINRANATLYSQGSINTNSTTTLVYPQTVVPAPNGDFTKIRGEERFSVYSLADYQAPESQLSSEFIQIWPVARTSIAGITASTEVKAAAPNVTISLSDLYPESFTYAQVYEGPQVLGTEGTFVPGASVVVSGPNPRNETIHMWDWDSVISTDGIWTMEIVTITPFGADRLGHVTFNVKRSIKVNGTVTSSD
jgi:hypothetical protein